MGAAISQAMRSFALWASGRSYRLILLTILFVQLLAPIAGALVVLDCLRRGPAAAATSALIALGALAGGAAVVGANVPGTIGLTAPVLVGGIASGALLSASRSLSLAFQGTVLGAIGLAVLIFTAVPGADGLGPFLLGETLQLLESLGLADDQIALFAEVPPGYLVQFLLTTLLVSLLAGLMLGCWWYALITEGVHFGEDFRALRLGRVAGALLMFVVALQLFVDSETIAIAAQMALIGFLFQGLAVMHARSRSDNWHGAIVVLVYVVLFVFSPLSLLVIAGLSMVGLVDNFFALRARSGPEE